MPLAGRVAVVTGAAHGIGTAIADALAADGAKVHRVDKEAAALDGSPLAAADLTDPAAVGDFFAAVGPVDILVNTAGGVAGHVGRPLAEALDAGIAMRRVGRTEDIANGVQFFASARSGWVTGQVIAIDGGSAFQ